MRKIARPVVWEGWQAQPCYLDPIKQKRKEERPSFRRVNLLCGLGCRWFGGFIKTEV
jgi:hypothetical protein